MSFISLSPDIERANYRDSTGKIIGGIPLTSNEAKELVAHDISEENELMRSSGLIYYEDIVTSLFGIPGRAIICFNHSDLEVERTSRLKSWGLRIGFSGCSLYNSESQVKGSTNKKG